MLSQSLTLDIMDKTLDLDTLALTSGLEYADGTDTGDNVTVGAGDLMYTAADTGTGTAADTGKITIGATLLDFRVKIRLMAVMRKKTTTL